MSNDRVTVTAYPDGPLILRGPARILGEDGRELPRQRATVALCRCGLTSRAPLCDGSHKLGPSRRRRESGCDGLDETNGSAAERD